MPIKTHILHILRISWPIIVGQLGMVLTGFFDNYMVAQVGYTSLAAAGISNSVYFLIAVFPMGVTMAYATVISILHGQGEEQKSAGVVRDALIVTLLISLVATALILLAAERFELIGQAQEVAVLAKPYLRLLAYSATPMLFFFCFKNICDGYHFTKAGMQVTLLSLLLNILFNWIFIYGNLGSPAYGLNGAGYATILARVIAVFVILGIMLRTSRIDIDLNRLAQAFRERKGARHFKQIFRIGLPTGFQYLFEVAAFAFAAVMAGWIGPKQLAAHNLAITLAALTYMFASGISGGANLSIAKAYGQKDIRTIRSYGNAALLITFSSMSVFALIFWGFDHSLAQSFSDDRTVVDLGASLLVMAAIFQLGDGVQAVSIGMLRGMEDVRFASFTTLLAYWGVAIPVGYVLGLNMDKGVVGIWVGLTLGLSCSAMLLCIRFYNLSRHP